MRLRFYAALGVLAALAFVANVPTANAAAVKSVVSKCTSDWYVNPDETDRIPVQAEDGFKFDPADLVHHKASLKLVDLKPGTYTASPAPDQPSFFSVEVVGDTGAYGTLRWNPTTSKWSITIGAGTGATAGTFEDANPVVLLTGKVSKWGAFNPATDKVVSFGVGYTLNPPGSKTVVVSKVVFDGKTYDLSCKPAPSSSAASPSSPASTSVSTLPTAGASLPVTGSKVPLVVGAGVLLLLAGGVLLVAVRRKHRFQA